jgi:hypothetical protein
MVIGIPLADITDGMQVTGLCRPTVARTGSDRAMREAASLQATGMDRAAGLNMIIDGIVNTIEIAIASTITTGTEFS